GQFFGTPHYVSPEQARGSQQLDIRSDLYSLGCTFYYAFSGRYPFQGTTALDIIARRLESDPVPLTSLRADIPQHLAGVVHRLMPRKPEHRFQSPAELLDALSYALGNLPREKSPTSNGPSAISPTVLTDAPPANAEARIEAEEERTRRCQ